jgi:ribose transport system substrate-binding protein
MLAATPPNVEAVRSELDSQIATQTFFRGGGAPRRAFLLAVVGAVASLTLWGAGILRAEEKKDIVIGFSQRRVAGSDWWKTLIAGATSQAEKLGVKIIVVDAGGDTVRQNSDIQTFITKGVNGVIINPNDPRGVSQSLAALKKAKIPFVAVNSNLDPSLAKDAFCYVAEDQVATGALAGKAIAVEVGKKFKPTDTIKLAIIGGYPGDVISDLRKSGFIKVYEDYFKENPGPKTEVLPMRYGNWLPDKALAPVRDIATANPDLKVVYSESDVMIAGIEQGLKQAGIWNDVLVASYDGQMSTIKQMMDNPTGPIRAIASNQPWDQGVTAVDMIVAAIKGDKAACPDGIHYIKTVLVTPENAKDFYRADKSYVQSAP